MLQHMPHSSKTNEGHILLKTIVVPRICTPNVRQHYRHKKEQLKDKPLVEPVNDGGKVDLLIASDLYYAVVKDGIIRLNKGTVAVETKVGYLVCGGQHKQLSLLQTKNHSRSSNGYKMSTAFFEHKVLNFLQTLV